VEYRSKDSDETTADAAGHFSLSAIYQRSIVKFLPVEFVAFRTGPSLSHLPSPEFSNYCTI
jgi:hypothetical protein